METPTATKLRIVGEILQSALDSNPQKDAESLDLLTILSSYEHVLSKYNIKPEQDLFYYRFLLQLNMDSQKNWFRKLEKHHNLLINSNKMNPSEIIENVDDSKSEINDNESCSPHSSRSLSSTKCNDLQNQYNTTWKNDTHHNKYNMKIRKQKPNKSTRNQFIDMLEAALEPKKKTQRTIMEIWRKFVTDNKIIYIGHNVTMSKAETYYEDRSMMKTIYKWRRYTKKRKTSRNKNERADGLYMTHLEKRIVSRWKLYVKYAKRYRKCLKRTKRWYLHRFVKQFWNCWYRQFLYYSELNMQSMAYFQKKYQKKVWNEWKNALQINHKINGLNQKQYFVKWVNIVQKNRIPILKKPSQIKAICIWTEYSFNCNIIDIVTKMKYHRNNNNVLCGKQIAMRIQNNYNLVWKSTRINQLNEMMAIYEKYYNVILYFQNWRKYTQNVQDTKIACFRAWRYIIINWKHQGIVANKYKRRNSLRKAFQIWKIRYRKEQKLQRVEAKIMRVRKQRLIKKYCSIWTLNLLSVLFHKNKLKTNTLRKWKIAIKQQKIETIMEEQSVLYRKRVLLFQGLNEWRLYLKQQKQKRTESLNVMLFRHSHLLLKALNRWKRSTQNIDQIRIKHNNIIIRNQYKMMLRSFRIWYRLYMFKKKVRNDMEISGWYHRVQALSQSISFWRYYGKIKRKRREQEINASIFYQNMIKQKGYKWWKEAILIRENELKLSIRYEIHLEKKLMIKTFEHWQKCYQQIQINQYVEEYYINKTLQTFMLRWKIGSEIEIQSNESKIRSFRQKYDVIQQSKTKQQCLMIWINVFNSNLDLKSKICQFGIKRDIENITSSFKIWRELTAKHKKYQMICNKCSIQLNRFQILYFMKTWKDGISRKNELIEKQQLIATNYRINTIKSLITNWKHIVIANNDRYNLLNHCYHQIRKKQTLKYFNKWKLSLIDNQNYNQLLSEHKHKSIKLYFNKWVDYYQYLIQQRQIEQKLREIHNKSVLIGTISIWKYEFMRIRNTKTALMTLNDIQQQYTLSSFINKWRDYSYFEQTKKRANNMYKMAIYRKVLIQWDNFSNIVSTERKYESYVYRFQMDHIIGNHFNQWRYQLNLIKIQQKLNAKFQHQRILHIFISWKGHSEDRINLRNKGKNYYDQRCKRIKNDFFILWSNLYQNEQSKRSHIQQWINNKRQKQCLEFLNKWKSFTFQQKQYQQQMETAKLYFKHKLLSKGLQIFKDHHSLQNNIDTMDDKAIYFYAQSLCKYTLSVWLQFIELNRKDIYLKTVCIEYKMYTFIQFWRNTCSRNCKLRSIQIKQSEQSEQHLIYRTFQKWKIIWNDIRKSQQFRTKSLSTKYLKIWRKSCIQKQIDVQNQIKCIKIVIIQRFWKKWNCVLSHRQHLFQTAMSCHNRRQFNLMKECYAEWKIQLMLQSKFKHIIDRRAERNTLIIFHHWFNKSYSSRINRKAITHHNTKILQIMWQKWKNHLIVYQMNNTKAMQYFQNAIQPKVLKYNLISWKIQTQQYKSTKIIVSIIGNYWNHRDLKLCLKKWLIFKRAQKRLKSIEMMIHCKHNMNDNKNIFVEWRYQFMIIKHIKQIHEMKNAELIRNCFASWKVFSHQEKALRAKTSFIYMELRTMPDTKFLCEYKLGNLWKHVRSPIFRHFMSWKASVQKTKKIEKDQQIAKSHHQNVVYSHCFNQWQVVFNDSKLMKKSSNYHRKYLLRIALIEWKSVDAERRNNQQLLIKASQFHTKQLLIRQVKLWSVYNQRNKSLQQKEINLIKMMNDRKMFFVLSIWTANANKLQLHRQQTWMSYEFRANKLKKCFFVIWLQQYAIHSSLRERELELIGVNNYKIIHDIFYKWCNTYNAMIYKADVLENNYNEICNYRLSKYFTLWLSVYNCTTNTRQRYLMSKIFTVWKHATKRRNQFKKQIIQKPYIVYD